MKPPIRPRPPQINMKTGRLPSQVSTTYPSKNPATTIDVSIVPAPINNGATLPGLVMPETPEKLTAKYNVRAATAAIVVRGSRRQFPGYLRKLPLFYFMCDKIPSSSSRLLYWITSLPLPRAPG
ncbi:MAG: hypothetical protein FD165_1490 [Gammaproteobacteria bacterium]|nr:MAG: hypothetical protein FD165_1490 [Gammaproteobacteria bacterium]